MCFELFKRDAHDSTGEQLIHFVVTGMFSAYNLQRGLVLLGVFGLSVFVELENSVLKIESFVCPKALCNSAISVAL